MSHQFKLFISTLFIFSVIVDQSSATLGIFGLDTLAQLAGLTGSSSGLNRFGQGGRVGGGLFPPSHRSDRSPSESAPTEPWPSAVRIVDFTDLPTLLFSRPNMTDAKSSGSLWSSIFNIFNNSPDETINDEMDRDNVAWFAIPGYNQFLANGSGLVHSILPGLLVPAKVTIDQLNQTKFPTFNPINNFTNMFPLNFLFNHDLSNINSNPFNLPLPSNQLPTSDQQEQNFSQMETLKMAQPID